jgi:hypothetical protein
MSGDFALADGITFGEWVHAHLHRNAHFERNGWAVERVQRVADRLQVGRDIFARLYVEVPWLAVRTAFTLPGRYIYFGRGLLEYCPDDETAAFVIAHEIAHHDLGHMSLFPHWMGLLVRKWGGLTVVFAMEGVERRLYGPERESAADRHAITLCHRAGYDVNRCLFVFHILEQLALDVGDAAIVQGPQEAVDAELTDKVRFTTKLRLWAWQRTRGYLPLRDRRATLLRFIAEGLEPQHDSKRPA